MHTIFKKKTNNAKFMKPSCKHNAHKKNVKPYKNIEIQIQYKHRKMPYTIYPTYIINATTLRTNHATHFKTMQKHIQHSCTKSIHKTLNNHTHIINRTIQTT